MCTEEVAKLCVIVSPSSFVFSLRVEIEDSLCWHGEGSHYLLQQLLFAISPLLQKQFQHLKKFTLSFLRGGVSFWLLSFYQKTN